MPYPRPAANKARNAATIAFDRHDNDVKALVQQPPSGKFVLTRLATLPAPYSEISSSQRQAVIAATTTMQRAYLPLIEPMALEKFPAQVMPCQ
jgi:hypothetical protein